MNRDDFIKKFKVGDKVRSDVWNIDEYLEILFMGKDRFFTLDKRGQEWSYSYTSINWLPYTEPKKKKTVKMAQALIQNNTYIYATSALYSSKEEARSFLGKLIQWPLVINNEEQWITVEVEE